MTSQHQFVAQKIAQPGQAQMPKAVINFDTLRERLKELGPGPYTPEQQKQRELILSYLSKENTQQQQQMQQNHQVQQGQQITSTNQATSSITHVESSSAQNQAQSAQQTASTSQILDKRALQDLVREVDPTEQLDEDVEDMLLQVADDFIENVINTSCQLAKHRKSNILEAKDVQFHLERNFNIWIPGFSSDELKAFKKSYGTEAHKQRLQLIKKSSKPADVKDKTNRD